MGDYYGWVATSGVTIAFYAVTLIVNVIVIHKLYRSPTEQRFMIVVLCLMSWLCVASIITWSAGIHMFIH